jgi:hypothetical protein
MASFASLAFSTSSFSEFSFDFSSVIPPIPPYISGGGKITDYRDQELLAQRRLIQNNNNAIILFLTS